MIRHFCDLCDAPLEKEQCSGYISITHTDGNDYQMYFSFGVFMHEEPGARRRLENREICFNCMSLIAQGKPITPDKRTADG